MSLRVYNRKRKFNQTPEPRGKVAKSGKGNLRFVVQMHDASRLHYDFRLEFGGVLKSWAVPKGPSLNPLDQRLAVFVEDHPLDYGSFEGIIPSGNYGAGTVMLWDEGTYVERGSEGRQDSEAAMKKNFEKGHITFVLDGHKLKGEFALIKLKKDESQKAWLLVKKRDEHSTYKRSEVPGNLSVKTGRSMEQIEKQAEKDGDVWHSHRGDFDKKSAGGKAQKSKVKARAKAKTDTTAPAKAKAATPRKAPVPRRVKPMLAVLSGETPDKNWIREPNVDGLRAIAEVEGKRVSLYSKAGIPFNKKFPQIIEALGAMNVTAVFDGEIVKNIFYISDLLYWKDHDLREEPLSERKATLQEAFADSKVIKHVGSAKSPSSIFKDPKSTYKSGTNSAWQIAQEKKEDEAPRATHTDKIYFPKDGITKGDLIDYYDSIAEFIIPYLKDRPESMNRMPNGIGKPGFFQKDLTGHIPRWLKTERIYSESANKSIDYLLCQDKRSLLYMANLGCIELNPWFSRTGHLDNPDFLVIDLDPDDNPFPQVIQIAHAIHEVLDNVGAANAVKTSGATGIHIGVPLGAKYDFDAARDFAEKICRVVLKKFPAITSMERSPGKRRKKIYLDYMQNRRGQTLAAPFCVRPKPGAPVSMPVTWKELTKNLKPEQFNIHNAAKRIQKFDDPWKIVLGPSVDLAKCVKAYTRKYGND